MTPFNDCKHTLHSVLHILVCFIFLCNPVFSQDQHKVDSLQQRLPRLSNEIEKIRTLNLLAWEISYLDLNKGLNYAEEALSLAKSMNDIRGIGTAYHTIGTIYCDMGVYNRSNEYLFEELKLMEKINDTLNKWICFLQLGIVNHAQKNYQKAFYYDSLSIEALEKNKKNDILLGKFYNNAGDVLSDIGKFSKALEMKIKALNINKKMGRTDGVALNHLGIASLLTQMEKYDLAQQNLLQAYPILCRESNNYYLPSFHHVMAKVYMGKENYPKAIIHLDSALKYLNEIGIAYMYMNIYEDAAKAYAKIGNYRKAYEFHQQFTLEKDSMYSNERTKTGMLNELNYEFDKKQQAIKAEQDKKDALAAQELANQRIVRNLFIAGFGLVLILAFVVYRGYRQKQKSNSQLEEKNLVIEEKNKSITDSINYAKRIQHSILPPASIWNKALPTSFVLFLPKDIVSGDFYWLEQTEECILFAAADCTGHGVPGALVSVMGHNNLERCVKEFNLRQPAQILDKLNKLVESHFEKSEEDIKDGMDIALCALHPYELILEYAGANNPLWLLRHGANAIEEYKADKQPIGKYEARKEFTNYRIPLQKGDTAYLFSDGYADQFGGEKGKKFLYKQLQRTILSIQDKNMQEQKELLLQTFLNWKKEHEQVDDVLVIGVRV